MKETEKGIQNALIAHINLRGHFVWRNNSGMVHMRNKYGQDRMWRAGIKGGADILGIAKDGHMIAIEVKVPGKQASLLQSIFLGNIKHRNGYAGVAHSIEEGLAIINETL